MRLRFTILAILLAINSWAGETSISSGTNFGGYRQGDAAYRLGGEHTPLVYTGVGTCSSTALGAYTTSWVQIGWSRNASASTNQNTIVDLNPEIFTLSLQTALAGAGDTSLVSTARFEVADSSSAALPFWNADSSNLFIQASANLRADYGNYTYLALAKGVTTRRTLYRLKVLQGDYIRLVFASTSNDTTTVTWTLKGEN